MTIVVEAKVAKIYNFAMKQNLCKLKGANNLLN